MLDRVTGRVKFYHAHRGFGIVVPDNTALPDVHVPEEVIKTFGEPLVKDAIIVLGDVMLTGKGWRATRVISQRVPAEWISGVWHPVAFKWLDGRRGYGFAVVEPTMEDVFIHKEVLRAMPGGFDFSKTVAGVRFEARITASSRGLMAIAARWPDDVFKRKIARGTDDNG